MNRRKILSTASLALATVLPSFFVLSRPAHADFTTSLDVETKVGFRRKSIRVMKELVDLTLISVQAEEYDAALNNFFVTARTIWFMFGGTVKRQAPQLFEPAQNNIKAIYEGLKQTNPNQANLLKVLTELQTVMAEAVNISDAKL